MSIKLIDDTKLSAIGNAIRTKGGTSALIDIDDMPQAIADLPSGGGGDPVPLFFNTATNVDATVYTLTPSMTINTSGDAATPSSTPSVPLADSSDWGVWNARYDGAGELTLMNGGKYGTDYISLSAPRGASSDGGINEIYALGIVWDETKGAFAYMYTVILGGDDSNVITLPELLRSVTYVSGSTYTFGYNGGSKTVELSDGEDGSDGFRSFTLGTVTATANTEPMQAFTFYDGINWADSFILATKLYNDGDDNRWLGNSSSYQTAKWLITQNKIDKLAAAILGSGQTGTLDEMTTAAAEAAQRKDNLPDAIVNGADLTAINYPNLTGYVAQYAFYSRYNITTVDLSSVSGLGQQAFYSCTALTSAKVNGAVGSKCFMSSTNLARVEIGTNAGSIAAQAFYHTALDTLIIRKTGSIAVLSATSAFTQTPIASGTGYIYVPSALVASYKAASNWSTYANQIRAIEDYPDICG